ncbi:hypothetical protein E2C01_070079 [Portunus trituberculatus]|uniref:Uncharacterized protein n=1 Tax=Portunus trituberculatus TaxID=210409 RepID=A0A5B7I163_PORTR|nr:hypothetical protein [Portunus trituberculatus]
MGGRTREQKIEVVIFEGFLVAGGGQRIVGEEKDREREGKMWGCVGGKAEGREAKGNGGRKEY